MIYDGWLHPIYHNNATKCPDLLAEALSLCEGLKSKTHQIRIRSWVMQSELVACVNRTKDPKPHEFFQAPSLVVFNIVPASIHSMRLWRKNGWPRNAKACLGDCYQNFMAGSESAVGHSSL